METLDFTLKPEAAAKIHDILTCLAKFSDTVAIEARRERLSFTALNSSKSAYASCSLEGKTFFSTYECRPKNSAADGRFTCSMYSKALLSVFKPRLDDARGKDTAIDRCEVSVQDRPDKTECRFVVKMVCNQGVTKTYKLTYESVEVLHALFDKNAAKNHWSISSGLLKEYIEYFGRKTEQLDIYAEEDRVVFTSFTEKITNGKEILKQPLQTAVAVNVADFEKFSAQERMHTIISVKDFRAIVLHAETLKTSLNAYYSHPTRPLQLNYTSDGMYCEFTLMTAGDYVDTPPPSAAPVGPSRTTSRAPSTATERSESRSFRQDMPPPPAPTTRTSARRLGNSGAARKAPSPIPSEADSESLFVGQDEDAQWDPAESRNDEETLGWDASAENDVAIYPTFRDSGSLARTQSEESADGVAPTQRISQIKGLW
ncbi:DNA repair protein Rad9 [Lophium mytilinum]|uniref:DNA repair protein rad9 n=1 Tax=Lophium mytilinum TaxID=390894 RepID=A0A6A6RBL0_9PEZI|nr:DNA repair protein Rad9 [Lophium mytilinum]